MRTQNPASPGRERPGKQAPSPRPGLGLGSLLRGGGLAAAAGRLLRRLLGLAVLLRYAGRPEQTPLLQHLAADLLRQGRVVAQVLLDVLPPLAQPHVAVAQPGAALVDQLVLEGQVDQVALAADAP